MSSGGRVLPTDLACFVADVWAEAFRHPGHLCNGLCPDTDEPGPDSRDFECFYCCVLMALDALKAEAA